MIVAHESGRPLRMSSGPAIQHAGDLAALLSSLVPGEVLFIDEIHRMARSAEEMLYLAMEDFRIDIMVGKGAGATSIPLDLAPFTLVGATTRSGLLPNPLRDRFGFTAHLEFYDDDELEQVLARAARTARARHRPRRRAPRSRRAAAARPRIANRLLRRVRDYALVHGAGSRPRRGATRRSSSTTSTRSGSTGSTARCWMRSSAASTGGPVGLNTLAVSVGEEPETIESVVEPFLVRVGMLSRTPRGRVATRTRLGAPRARPDAPGAGVAGRETLFDDDV